ncbi:rhodanese-like domain-containing protein [Glaciecola sp. 1036]|uniref:rhodanese-like domain-containing protein n=1 Tax=Alteromonadaceae TaxID=72275 RepID=UPI003D044580
MTIKSVDANTLQKWIDDDQVELIDVREPMEFHGQHIPGATLVPLGTISSKSLPSTNKKIVIYCQKGIRGKSACQKVVPTDQEHEIYNLEGGILSWIEAQHPVKQSKTEIASLNKQVTISFLVITLCSLFAAIYVNPAFVLFIIVLVGMWLRFAITKSSPLAVLLAKMPWNQKLES